MMTTKVALLLICFVASLCASRDSRENAAKANNEREEMKRDIKVGVQILRDSLKALEEMHLQVYNEAVPVVSYDDTTHFIRNLGNLAYWQAVRLAPGYNETTVNANWQEKELIRIAEYLSKK